MMRNSLSVPFYAARGGKSVGEREDLFRGLELGAKNKVHWAYTGLGTGADFRAGTGSIVKP
jgi:hypothetical protein